MTQSASASPTPNGFLAFLRHPLTALVAVMLVAMFWATVGFASALFTNEIVVSDGSYGLIRASWAGPAALGLLAIGFALGRGLRPRHDAT